MYCLLTTNRRQERIVKVYLNGLRAFSICVHNLPKTERAFEPDKKEIASWIKHHGTAKQMECLAKH